MLIVSDLSVLSCPRWHWLSEPWLPSCVSPASHCLLVYLNLLLPPSCAGLLRLNVSGQLTCVLFCFSFWMVTVCTFNLIPSLPLHISLPVGFRTVWACPLMIYHWGVAYLVHDGVICPSYTVRSWIRQADSTTARTEPFSLELVLQPKPEPVSVIPISEQSINQSQS